MIKKLITTAAALVLCTSGAFASGSSPIRPQLPPPSGAVETTDSAKYELGKAVFNGKAALGATNAATVKGQKARLAAAATAAGKPAASWSANAGRLSEGQLSALEYYIAKRH